MNNNVLTDQLSIAGRNEKLTTQSDNEHNIADATNDCMSESNPTERAEQIPPVQFENLYADGGV